MDWVQWLALTGGLAAAVSFVASRREMTSTEAASVYVDVTGFQPAPAPGKPLLTRYKIVNNGRLPIFAVGISAWGWGRRRFLWRARRRQNWMTGKRIVGHVYPSIRPSSVTEEEQLPGVEEEGPPDERPPVMLTFRDGFGRSWVRWPDGKLTRLAPSLSQLERVRAHRTSPRR